MYRKLSRFIQEHKLTLYADILLMAASGYLVIKKAFDFSISGWLLNNILHQAGVNAYVYISGILVVLALFVKAISLANNYFPISKHVNVEPEEISECLQVMNNEIASHINKCDGSSSPDIKQLGEQHQFDVNVSLISEELAEHIRKSVTSIKIKNKDLFISLYSYDEDINKLNYELHYHPRRDLVRSKSIDLTDKAFEQYECVKCMNSCNSTAYVVDKNEYKKGGSKRHKTFFQYMGCKLENHDHVFGFLNIEFHNYDVFIDEDEMQDFMEENIFPFKLLLEYQYLKRDFFSRFKDFEKNWEN